MQSSLATTQSEQGQRLDEAKGVVKHQAFHMKRALDQNDFRAALRHASSMICELRTSLLSPKNYYELYMLVFDELRHLESFFLDEWKGGKSMASLYELVQHSGNILPRLYLLITIGSVYIRSKQAPARDILKDLVEMCRGVQHPTRGLFVRNYLSQLCKDKLPDFGSEYEGPGGTVRDSIDFVLQNFLEMNKLWVRMQHQGSVKLREKREREREQLKLLVGTNLVRLSQLEGVDLNVYKQTVLPRVLEQVVSCKDVIAQQYLMDIIIQVFPDEYHLATLESLLNTCTQLQGGVDSKAILVSLMDRLGSFVRENPDSVPEGLQMFKVFGTHVANVTTSAGSAMDVPGILELQTALVNFAITCYPEKLNYVDQVMAFVSQVFDRIGITCVEDPKSVRLLVKLLTTPLESCKDTLLVLNLENWPRLLRYVSSSTGRQVAVSAIKNLLKTHTHITDVGTVEKLFDFIGPLVADAQPDSDTTDPVDEEFAEEQNMVGALVHLFTNDDTDVMYKMVAVARRNFGRGGAARVIHTLPPLVFKVLMLARAINSAEASESRKVGARKVFQFCHETVTALSASAPRTSLNLFLQCASAAAECGYDTIAYEFVTQAFVLYENELSHEDERIAAVQVIRGTLHRLRVFNEEDYTTLITKATQYSAKLLKKPDQTETEEELAAMEDGGDAPNLHRDGKRVLECLQRSLKIADACIQTSMHVNLFVEILNHYLYYFEQRNEAITVTYLNGLIQLINEHIADVDSPEEAESAKTHFENTRAHMALRKQDDGDETDERFKELAI